MAKVETEKKTVNRNVALGVMVFCIVLVIGLAGVVVNYSSILNNKDSIISNLNGQIGSLNAQNSNLQNKVELDNSTINLLNSQIASLNNEITNLSSQIHGFGQSNLTSPYLVTALGITEIASNSSAFSRVWISGSVTNTGEGTAFNAGLHVVAYAANGTLEVSMTVPLNNDNVVNYGTDAATDDRAYIANGDNYPSFFLVSLGGGGTAYIGINIFHEGTVSNWTVTPVWTNSP